MDLLQFVDLASNDIRMTLMRSSTKAKRRVNHRRYLQKQLRRYRSGIEASAIVSCSSRNRAKGSKNLRKNMEDAALSLQVVPDFGNGPLSEGSRTDTNTPSECSFTESCDAPVCESWEALLTPIDYHNVPLTPTTTSTTSHNRHLMYTDTLYHPEVPEDDWGWMPSQPDLCYPASTECTASDIQAVPECPIGFNNAQSIRELLEQPRKGIDENVAATQPESDNLGVAADDANGWLTEVLQQQNEFNDWYHEVESTTFPTATASYMLSNWDGSAGRNGSHLEWNGLHVESSQMQCHPINDDISNLTDLITIGYSQTYADQRIPINGYI